MAPITLDIANDFVGEEAAYSWKRRVQGDSTRSHWSRTRSRVRRQWRERAQRVAR